MPYNPANKSNPEETGFSCLSLNDLLVHIRDGNRDAAAELGMRFASEIRRRIRGQLGPEMRRLFDSQDILSTVLRRLDVYVTDHPVTASTEREIRALLLRICNNAVIDKIRVIKRLKRTEGEDSPLANMMLRELGSDSHNQDNSESTDLVHFFEKLPSSKDRTILWLWLAGHDLKAIAVSMDMNHAALRKRWQRIKQHLKESISSEVSRVGYN